MIRREDIPLQLRRSLSPIYVIGSLLIGSGIYILYYTITHRGPRPIYIVLLIEILAVLQIITCFFLFKCRSWACLLAMGFIGLNALFFTALCLSENFDVGIIITLVLASAGMYYLFRPYIRGIFF